MSFAQLVNANFCHWFKWGHKRNHRNSNFMLKIQNCPAFKLLYTENSGCAHSTIYVHFAKVFFLHCFPLFYDNTIAVKKKRVCKNVNICRSPTVEDQFSFISFRLHEVMVQCDTWHYTKFLLVFALFSIDFFLSFLNWNNVIFHSIKSCANLCKIEKCKIWRYFVNNIKYRRVNSHRL